MSMRTWVALCFAAWLSLSVCSCTTYTQPTAGLREMTEAQRSFEITWRASQDVLRRYNFELDRLDRRAGVITTEPLTGKHWFEFWRHDAATNFDLAEGTVQTVYRSATVTIRPVQPGGTKFKATVEVTVERSDILEPQLTSTSEAYDLFILPGGGEERGRYLLDYGRDELGRLRGGAVPLGRDGELERILAAAIADAAATGQGR